jgi:hypothetical protein
VGVLKNVNKEQDISNADNAEDEGLEEERATTCDGISRKNPIIAKDIWGLP